MITIKLEPGMDPDVVLLQNAYDIREHGIKAIRESFDLDLKEAHVAEFEVAGEYIDFVINRDNWMDFLESSLEPLMLEESYDILIEVRSLMREITEKK